MDAMRLAVGKQILINTKSQARENRQQLIEFVFGAKQKMRLSSE
jgi:hypothetical protein